MRKRCRLGRIRRLLLCQNCVVSRAEVVERAEEVGQRDEVLSSVGLQQVLQQRRPRQRGGGVRGVREVLAQGGHAVDEVLGESAPAVLQAVHRDVVQAAHDRGRRGEVVLRLEERGGEDELADEVRAGCGGCLLEDGVGDPAGDAEAEGQGAAEGREEGLLGGQEVGLAEGGVGLEGGGGGAGVVEEEGGVEVVGDEEEERAEVAGEAGGGDGGQGGGVQQDGGELGRVGG